MREYELLYMIRTDITEEQTEATIAKFEGIMNANGVEITNVDRWGKRKLAYIIDKKHRDGFYVLIKFNGTPEAVKEIDRLMKIDETVLRHMITRVGE